MSSRPTAKLAIAVRALVVLGAMLFAGCGSMSPPAKPGPVAIRLQAVSSGLASPLDLEQPPDGSGRLFVVEQGGRIRVLQNSASAPQQYLDISSKIVPNFAGTEMGLLGMTFHPSFQQNRKFYVNYVRSSGGQIQSVIAEYLQSSSNPNQADPASERILLVVDQVGNFGNHKAGQLAFGPDGFLYFGLGDGGSGGDPFGNGQNRQTLLGKMMRIDVNSTSPGLAYGIPPDNPFVNGGGLSEIFAFGFRNPWRFSFDRISGRLFVADVGQNSFEEVDLVQKGGNYGWNIMEGNHCFQPSTGCNMAGLTLPIVEIPHPEGEAVIGGFVYHGTALAGLQGQYIFGDLNGKIWTLQEGPPNTFTRTLLSDSGLAISSFGRDQTDELYVVDLSGNIFKITPQ